MDGREQSLPGASTQSSSAHHLVGKGRRIFGHPRGLAYLTATEAWNAFALYGVLSLLVLYMVGELLLPTSVQTVAGLEPLRAVLEQVSGPLSTVALASQIFGLFAALICFTPVLGGLVADRLAGPRVTVVLGGLLLVAGNAAMMWPETFVLALVLLILGSGCVTGNLKAQLSGLYRESDPHRPSGFAIGLIGINLGAFAAPLVCGSLGELYGWRFGFGAAAVGMALGLLVYLAGARHLPDNKHEVGHKQAPVAGEVHTGSLIAAAGVIGLNVFYYGAYNQTFNMFPLWARDMVEREVSGFAIPVTWFLAADGLFAMTATLIMVLLWRRQSKQKEPQELSRLTIGFALMACAFVTLAAGEIYSGERQVSAGWCLLFFIFTATAAPFIWSSTLSLVSRLAPRSLQGTLMGGIAISAFAGNLLVGWSGTFFEQVSPAIFWFAHAAIPGAALLILLVCRPFFSAALARTGSEPRDRIFSDGGRDYQGNLTLAPAKKNLPTDETG